MYLLDSEDEGSVLAVWDGAAAEGNNDNSVDSVVVLEDQHIDMMVEDNNSEATIERPAPFGYDNWRKFTNMHPGRPNGMGFLIFGSPQTWSRPLFLHRFANGRFLRQVSFLEVCHH